MKRLVIDADTGVDGYLCSRTQLRGDITWERYRGEAEGKQRTAVEVMKRLIKNGKEMA